MRISDWSSDVCSSDLRGSLGLNGYIGLRSLIYAATLILRTIYQVFLVRNAQELIIMHPAMPYLKLVGAFAFAASFTLTRSEERRLGKECVSTGSSRWSPDH